MKTLFNIKNNEQIPHIDEVISAVEKLNNTKDDINLYYVKGTYNYDKFKLFGANRFINDRKVNVLIKSIVEKNLTPANVIIVDENYNIIDGQHRFTACKTAHYPIYYIQMRGLTDKDIKYFHVNHENWKAEDYLNFYTKHKIPYYVALTNWMLKYGFTKEIKLDNEKIQNVPSNVSTALKVLVGTTFLSEDFIQGYWTYTEEEMVKATEFMNYLIELKNDGNLGQGRFIYRSIFIKAMLELKNKVPAFDFNHFKSQLAKYQTGELMKSTKYEEYFVQIENIYNKNYRNLLLLRNYIRY